MKPNITRRSDLIKLFRKRTHHMCFTSKYLIMRELLPKGRIITNWELSEIALRYGARIEEIKDIISPYGYEVLVDRVGKTQTYEYQIVKIWKGLTW